MAGTSFGMISRYHPTVVTVPHEDSLPAVLIDLLPVAVLAGIERHLTKGGVVEEIRLRAERCASLTVGGENIMTDIRLTSRELSDLLTRMCGGSLYAYTEQIRQGFMTLEGGVRVGVVGRAACEDGRVVGVREISALCVRLPHVHGHVGGEICQRLDAWRTEGKGQYGVLIYAPPGVGKTTLLRGVAARLAGGHHPRRTVVIDTRGELTFDLDGAHLCLDVLTGYPRPLGVEIAARTMGAEVLICDEIGDTDEAMALVSAHNVGIPLVAAAHGGSVDQLLRRTGIRLLHEARIFGLYAGIRRDGRGDFVYDMTEWEVADRVV